MPSVFDLTESSEIAKHSLLNFANHFRQLPDWLQKEPVLLKQFLQVLSADLQVANSISEEDSAALDDIPVLAFYGKEDPYFFFPGTMARMYPPAIQAGGDLRGHFISDTQAREISELTMDFIRNNKVFNI